MVQIMNLKPPYDGYACIEDGTIYLSVVIVEEKERGKGLFHKLIQDTKAAYDTIKIPQPSPFLQSVLLRYGFREIEEYFEEADEMVPVMIWQKKAQ